MGNEVSTMDMAEFDAQNQIVSGEASPLLLPRCIRPDLFKITICDLEQGAWTEHQIQAMWVISPFIRRISGGGSGRACRGLSGKRHSCRFSRWGEASRRVARAHLRNSPMRIEFWKQPEQLVKTTLREVRGLTRPRFFCLLHIVFDGFLI